MIGYKIDSYRGTPTFSGIRSYTTLGVNLKKNLELFWREFFIDDSIHEVENPIVIPKLVMTKSNYLSQIKKFIVVDKFNQVHTMDALFGHNNFSDTKSIENLINRTKKLQRPFRVYEESMLCPLPSEDFLRPDLAQGILCNLDRYSELFDDGLPAGLCEVGRVINYYDDFKLKEWSVATLHLFIDPDEEIDHMSNLIDKAFNFLHFLNIDSISIERVDQLTLDHFSVESHQIMTKKKVPIIRLNNRGSYDIKTFDRVKMVRRLRIPRTERRLVLKPDVGLIRKRYKRDTDKIVAFLKKMDQGEIEKFQDGKPKLLCIDDNLFTITNEFVKIVEIEEKILDEHFMPEIIEVNFNIDWIIDLLLESEFLPLQLVPYHLVLICADRGSEIYQSIINILKRNRFSFLKIDPKKYDRSDNLKIRFHLHVNTDDIQFSDLLLKRRSVIDLDDIVHRLNSAYQKNH